MVVSFSRRWSGSIISLGMRRADLTERLGFECVYRYVYKVLSEQRNRRLQVKPRIIEPQPPIKPTDRVNLIVPQIKIGHFQVLRKPVFVVRLGDHRNTTLRRPAQQDLSRGLPHPRSSFPHHVNVPEESDILRPRAESGREFFERLRAEGGVGRHCYVQFLGQGDESRLYEVRVVFNLQGGHRVAGVGLQVVEGLCLGVGNSD